MNLRNVARTTGLLLAVSSLGCTKEGYKLTDVSNLFEVSPSFLGVDQASTPIQFTATVGGDPVAVTWASSNPLVASVSATGLVSPSLLIGGFTAITATQTANATALKSASLTVFPLIGTGLTKGVAVTGLASALARGTMKTYYIVVPAGTTNLTVTTSSPAANGDTDIFVKKGVPPTSSDYTCSSENGGNNESCSITNPAAGVWYINMMVWDPYTNVTLTATYTP